MSYNFDTEFKSAIDNFETKFKLANDALDKFKIATDANAANLNTVRNKCVKQLDDVLDTINIVYANYKGEHKALTTKFKKINNAYYTRIAKEKEAKKKAAEREQKARFESMRKQFNDAFEEANAIISEQDAIIKQAIEDFHKGVISYEQFKQLTGACMDIIHTYTKGENEAGKCILDARNTCLCSTYTSSLREIYTPIKFSQISLFDLYGKFQRKPVYNNGYNCNWTNSHKYILRTNMKEERDDNTSCFYWRCHCSFCMCPDCKTICYKECCNYCFPDDPAGN